MANSWSSTENSESEPKIEAGLVEENENSLKNISPYMSKDLIAAAGFNVETPIVNAIIGNLTGNLPRKKSETEMLICDICHVRLSSNIVSEIHNNGSKHKKRLKALEIMSKLKGSEKKVDLIKSKEIKDPLECEICLISLNSAQQLERHLSGIKHRKKVAKAISQSIEPSKGSETAEEPECYSPPNGKKRKKEVLIQCKVCRVFVNSQVQYDQHLLSKRHLIKAGKISGNNKNLRKTNVINAKGSQVPMNGSSQKLENAFVKNSKLCTPQFFNRLVSYSNFFLKNSFYGTFKSGEYNLGSYRQSMVTYQLYNKFL